jgi:acyl-CoA hydrolase
VISTGRTSMEVFVKVESEDLAQGVRTLTTTSILTMVAKDENGMPSPVPGVSPQTEEEERLLKTAKLRKKRRLEMRNH